MYAPPECRGSWGLEEGNGQPAASARERRQCEPVSHRLAESREARFDTVERLCAADVPSKTRDHLVEDQEGTVGMTEIAHVLQKSRFRLIVLRRLENDAGDRIGIVTKP